MIPSASGGKNDIGILGRFEISEPNEVGFNAVATGSNKEIIAFGEKGMYKDFSAVTPSPLVNNSLASTNEIM
jgi:hypothetical protein